MDKANTKAEEQPALTGALDQEGEPAHTQESELVDESEPRRPIIEFRNVSLSFDEKKVLDRISFRVVKSEIKIILSGSGGGKSTILKLILGLVKPDEGEIFIDGEEITKLDETELQHVRNKIGMVFQEGGLFDSLSVYDNALIVHTNRICLKRTWKVRCDSFYASSILRARWTRCRLNSRAECRRESASHAL